MIEHFERPAGLGPVNGYSHATAGTGRLVAISGQLPMDADGNIADDPQTQARQAFANLTIALAAAGAHPADVLRLTVFLTDLADLAAFRTARDEWLQSRTPPASTLVQVTALVNPKAKIEIDALANA